ncbi:pterin 4 alpha carbinolamine dehydratase-domain-containing protein [Lineolata rhizophorae]|uniref:4a-hydroxytetrahydrobiopterin dehydratase n=1 Tax=Lineolata rhizophorae TaxID=578093 RepID=A0A6A6NN98_9PEZI|nr:pterin 4 alpha carbinolamine dehydratase-domain-containing protein [Lineolata rhizophorae]
MLSFLAPRLVRGQIQTRHPLAHLSRRSGLLSQPSRTLLPPTTATVRSPLPTRMSSNSSSPSPTSQTPPGASTPIFGPNTDAEALTRDLSAFLSTTPWRLSADRMGLERHFRFRTFKDTWAYMTTIAAHSQSARHHPEWTNVYSSLHVRWTTHAPRGLSAKDLAMARLCEAEAAKLGDKVVPVEQPAVAVGSSAEGMECGCGEAKREK